MAVLLIADPRAVRALAPPDGRAHFTLAELDTLLPGAGAVLIHHVRAMRDPRVQEVLITRTQGTNGSGPRPLNVRATRVLRDGGIGAHVFGDAIHAMRIAAPDGTDDQFT